MAKNTDLNAAGRAKKDEFYTQRVDIESELYHYAEQFRDKVVYCNCDDPVSSEFWRFFVRNFKPWGLKKLMATHYEPDEKNYSYSLEICEDTNGDGRIDIHDEPTIKQLPCNGDFRSAACIELLQEADIVVTNPPFSLFREYVAQLLEYGKKFVIIGSLNAITYKEFFPLIMDGKVWMGSSIHSGDREFQVPDDYPLQAAGWRVDELGRKFIRVKGVRWWTNLDYKERHTPLDLRGNYYYGNEARYPRFDNYDAINVDVTADIPCDYDGIMGVPISFLDKFCPDQFEIVGITDRQDTYGFRTKKYGPDDSPKYNDLNARGVVRVNGEYKAVYARILIRRKKGDNQ